MPFSKNLLIERKKLGLSAQGLAKRIGVSRSYITLIESGKRLPGRTLLTKIAKALQLKKEVVVKWYLTALENKIKGE